MATDNVRSDESRGGDGAGRDDKPASTGRTLIEYALLAIVAVAVALLIQAFLVKPYRIPSESMENTLLIGDRVLVDRISWRFSEPQRGEITVFHPPFSGPVLIKRIVGMPGDVISLRDGYVYINGVKLVEPYVRRVGGRQEPTDPFTNGLAWSLQQPYHVPAGMYFMMGDNRSVSDDSRDWGPAPRREIIGEAFLTYWPLTRLRGL
jgi:signal peptidase I